MSVPSVGLKERAVRALDEMAQLRGSLKPTRDPVMASARDLILRQARAYWWDPSILEVIVGAALQLPTWTVRAELFPVPVGFFFFPEPLMQAIGWVPARSGPTILSFRHGRDDRHAYLAGGLTLPYGSDAAAEIRSDLPEGVGERSAMDLQLLGAALLFLEHDLLVDEEASVDRAARRRLARATVTSDLRVIRLRREIRASSSDSTQTVNWQHRWLVRFHWRQQFYRSDGSHRPIPIAPYVKGPADKPLAVPKRSVFAVDR